MSLYITSKGSGPDIIFIHGWAMNSLVWQAVMMALAQSFCVHALDLPGYGQSDVVAPYTVEQIVAKLDLAFPHPVHVVAWSWGGTIAVQWALMHAHKIRSLTLVAYNPCFIQRTDWLHGITLDTFSLLAQSLKSNWKSALQRFIGLQAMGDTAARSVERFLVRCLSREKAPVLAVLESGLALLRNTDQRLDFVKLACPIRLHYGKQDRLIPISVAQWLARADMKDACNPPQLTVYPHAAHAPFISCQAQFIEQIQKAYLESP